MDDHAAENGMRRGGTGRIGLQCHSACRALKGADRAGGEYVQEA
jgi:hypothetical protein